MLLVGLAVAVPATIVLSRDGSDDSRAAAHRAPPIALKPRVRDRALDVRYLVPRGWHERRHDGVIELASADRATGVTISAPGPAHDRAQVFNTAIEVLKERYAGVRLVATKSGQKLGGGRAKTATLTAAGEHGTKLNMLSAVAAAHRRAYLVELFTSPAAPTQDVAEAQALLNGLELKR
jgi:hypothetical protein